MWDIKPRRVLLAVESTECEAAIAYAVREARSRRCGVHVIHVVPTTLGRPQDTLVMVGDELHARGRDILADVARSLERRLGDEDLPVSTELCHGTVVRTLVQESAHASVVVVQTHAMESHGGPSLMSVTSGVAARSHAPVVAVPSDWREPPEDAERVVAVGIGDTHSGRILDVAVATAARLGAVLRIVHAGDELELHELAEAPSDVAFTFTESAESPVHALLSDGGRTSLIVVGRRHPAHPLAQRLGPVARTLLRRSTVPVMVVDPRSDDEAGSGRDLATAAVP
ncbi:MAG: universal stress protein [Nocardioides sp.]|jgi:nucleotide-binding universal stress UspA family protein